VGSNQPAALGTPGSTLSSFSQAMIWPIVNQLPAVNDVIADGRIIAYGKIRDVHRQKRQIVGIDEERNALFFHTDQCLDFIGCMKHNFSFGLCIKA
jgi:hypothetical protein